MEKNRMTTRLNLEGDTIFRKGLYGRVDLPSSLPSKMDGSLEKLEKIDYDVLCCGHDY